MKKFLVYLFSFLLSICLIVIVSLIVVKNTVLDRNYVKDLLEKENYYEKLSFSTKEQMKNYVIQSGFTDEILEGIYEEEDIKNDVNKLIEQVYNNEEIYLDNSKLKENLKKSIVDYLKDKNIKLVSQEEIDKFVNMIGDVYSEEVGITDSLKPVQTVLNKVFKCFNPVLYGSIGLGIVLTIVLLLLNKNGNKRRVFSVPLFTLSFVYIIAIVFLKNKIDIDNLLILSKDISSVIGTAYLDILNNLKTISIISFISGIILSLWSVLRAKIIKN